ncbi:DNA-directed RNA polymerase subunit omega [Clostridiaceae bacterium UIB06]|uniref:DNA-directed RNA polymerase subunit omega n=1 Tax=Clostridium thailandense TaxID=2794346 RepID=A0A949TVV9_9CLOT|nr:DNA-directed RNA polymerase subunit omega [Clostridium thailandense]MBV7271933.1 DNA-directed RNA polymerase subunit omega [Clostridium thailandense]MCH5137159.1 DNA-directed RNA polymerase subunit omega [Clostridiaceae bacterium UIB06]
MNNSMIDPSIVDLLKKVDNRYTLVTMTAKRARQLIEGEEPLVRTNSTKPVTISINEISQGAITYETVREGIK